MQRLLIPDIFKNSWYVWYYTNWSIVCFSISWVFLWTGVIFANFKWFGKFEKSTILLKWISRKGEKLSLNILVDMLISCTDLLDSNLLNSFCKLDKLTLENKKSGIYIFLDSKYTRMPFIFMHCIKNRVFSTICSIYDILYMPTMRASNNLENKAPSDNSNLKTVKDSKICLGLIYIMTDLRLTELLKSRGISVFRGERI